MIRTLPTYLFLFLNLGLFAQSTLSGTVTDESGEPLIGANIYLKDTYDGATSNAEGYFSFETYEQGAAELIVSFVGFESAAIAIEVGTHGPLEIRLEEAFNTIDAVTISAGTFEASDQKKVVVLQSLDIATTAGATADITGALNTLPGTQTVGESGRLFVRGGTAEETKIYVDGAEAANYYGSSTDNIPTRSRFSPFLFKGTFFSTGGYSAEYGQALSSALILNTLDVDPTSKIDLSLMTVGLDAGITKSWSDQSLYLRGGYTNLNPYNELIDQRIRWEQATISWDGTMAYKRKLANGGRLKALAMGNTSSFSLEQQTALNARGWDAISLDNQNAFATASLELPVGEHDQIYFGASRSWNKDDLTYNGIRVETPIVNQHFKTKYLHEFSPKTVLNSGVELFSVRYEEELEDTTGSQSRGFDQVKTAMYSELDQYLSEKWMLRLGMRVSHDDLLRSTKVSPRFSMAYKLDDYAQVSLASGIYHQAPENDFLKVTTRLDQQQAAHYILNYQRVKSGKVLRVEGYLKDYDRLVTFLNPYDPTSFHSNGDGYAYGADLFWRDRGGIPNVDYWVSYSWLKSERKYRDFPEMVAPGFGSEHNFSFVFKKFFPRLRSQMGATYSYTSGRPYENPNLDGFNESLTDGYHDLSYNIAYLPSANVIFYFSATNLLGFDQVFGYKYAARSDEEGTYAAEAVRLPAKRFLFLGCFITIGAFNNQLENL